MIDILPPEFYGTEEEQLTQMEQYLTDFHDTLERKYKNLDMSDLNYTLAEMVKKRNQDRIRMRGNNSEGARATELFDNAYFYSDSSGEWACVQEYVAPDYLLSYGYARFNYSTNTEEKFPMKLARKYREEPMVFSQGVLLNINDQEKTIIVGNPPSVVESYRYVYLYLRGAGIAETEFIVLGFASDDSQGGLDTHGLPWIKKQSSWVPENDITFVGR